MIKEKIILFPVLFVISVVLIDIAFDFSLITESTDSEKISKAGSNKNDLKANAKNSSIATLDILGWGNDVFYDRSDIYDKWFNLTGIMEFENGRKAIINDEIVRTNERVRGFYVDEITDNKVVLTRHKYRVTLNLEK